MAETSAAEQGAEAELPFKCLALDLEVGTKTSRIHAFAAVRSGDGESFHRKFGGAIRHSDWKQLDVFAGDAEILVGHNLIAHDIPQLQAVAPALRLLELPPLDTLRLSPLAFPRNPYHGLVKHYKDGGIVRGLRNDPELDCRASLKLLGEEIDAFRAMDTTLAAACHWLTTRDANAAGFDRLFASVRGQACPAAAEARAAIAERLDGQSCATAGRKLLEDAARGGWPLACALAWLSVAGGNSVMPPWVRHEFPETARLVRRLRDTACAERDCAWCRERHDANRDASGKPMQRSIVEAVMASEHALGVLPTGIGKSLCYQIPALSRYHKTGALTVVISPLVALMADQVTSLEKRGIDCSTTINGMLSLPERAAALDRVRLGDAGIVLLSPEQLRSSVVRKALEQREVGLWVLDEAHCLSRWGHDFRPDYRYIARFIKRMTESQAGYQAPVLCLTATAKPEVIDEIRKYFWKNLGIELRLFNGGARRENLDFVVVRTTESEKYHHISQVLASDLPPDRPGGAIIYLFHEAANRRNLRFFAGTRYRRGFLPCRFAAGDEKIGAAGIHRGRIAGDCRDQCFRHGHRQTGCAPRDSRGHSRVAGKLLAGGGQSRPRPGGGSMRSALHAGRRGTSVRHGGAFTADPA